MAESWREVFDEALRLKELGDRSDQPEEYYPRALDLFLEARRQITGGSVEATDCLLSEASIWINWAEGGGDREASYRRAVECCSAVFPACPPRSELFARCSKLAVIGHWGLAAGGVDPGQNLVAAIALLRGLQECPVDAPVKKGQLLDNEAWSWLELAKLEIEGREEKLRNAIDRFCQARDFFPEGSPEARRGYFSEGDALIRLAELGIEPEENLGRAVMSFAKASKSLEGDRDFIVEAMMSEAAARIQLADLDVDAEVNLQKAIACYRAMRIHVTENSPNLAASFINEGLALIKLAQRDIDPGTHWACGADCFAQAREVGSGDTVLVKASLESEAFARAWLVHCGIDAVQNEARAYELSTQARRVGNPMIRLVSEIAKGRLELERASQEVDEFLSSNELKSEEVMVALDDLIDLDVFQLSRVFLAVELCRATLLKLGAPLEAVRVCLVSAVKINMLPDEVATDASLKLCDLARKMESEDQFHNFRCCCYELTIRSRRSVLNPDDSANLQKLVEICQFLRDLEPAWLASSDRDEDMMVTAGFTGNLITEADARRRLAELDFKPEENYREAAVLCALALAKKRVPEQISLLEVIQLEMNSRLKLIELAVDSASNYRRCAQLSRLACVHLQVGSRMWAVSVMQEGDFLRLANKLNEKSEPEYEEAIRLLQKARQAFPKGAEEDLGWCIKTQANAYLNVAEVSEDSPAKCRKAIELFHEARGLIPSKSSRYGLCLMNEGSAYSDLAEFLTGSNRVLGDEAIGYFQKALGLYREAREYFLDHPENLASTLINEANAFFRLARAHVDADDNYKKAIETYEEASSVSDDGSRYWIDALMDAGRARVSYCENCKTDTVAHGRRIIESLERVQSSLLRTSSDYGECLSLRAQAWIKLAESEESIDRKKANYGRANELYVECESVPAPDSTLRYGRLISRASILVDLAGLGIDRDENCEKIADLYREARDSLPEASPELADVIAAEAISRRWLASLGVASRENCERSIGLFEQARAIRIEGSPAQGDDLVHESQVHLELVTLRIDAVEHCRKAIELCREAQSLFQHGSSDWSWSVGSEATAWISWAGLGFNQDESNCRAIELYRKARIVPDSSNAHGINLKNEGVAWQNRALLGVNRLEYLRNAIALFQDAQSYLDEGSSFLGICYRNEGGAWSSLASMHSNPGMCFHKSYELAGKSSECYPPGSPGYGRALLMQGDAIDSLAELRVGSKQFFRQAIELFRSARACFAESSEDVGRCASSEGGAWASLAVLPGENDEAQLNAERCFREAVRYLHSGSAMHLGANLRMAEFLLNQDRLLDAYSSVEDAVGVIESVSHEFGDLEERRKYRHSSSRAYKLIAEVCLRRSKCEQDFDDREALHWEAWNWVQRGKARNLKESLASFAESPKETTSKSHAQIEELLGDYSRLDRAREERPSEGTASRLADTVASLYSLSTHSARSGDLRSSGDEEESATTVPGVDSFRSTLEKLANLGRYLVVEFFPGWDGRFGLFMFATGEARRLAAPVWLEGSVAEIGELVREYHEAIETLSHDPQNRTRDGEGRRGEQGADFARARETLKKIGSELGNLLQPLRTLIGENKWEDRTLLLCPSGPLHLLPFAAAEWGGIVELENGFEIPRTLIDVHPLVHLPTASLAQEIIDRERPLQKKAYIAAADPFGSLRSIYGERQACESVLSEKGFSVASFEREEAEAQTIWEHGKDAWIVHLAMHSGISANLDFCGVEFHDRRFTVLELMAWVRLPKAALAVVATCSSSRALDLMADDPSTLARAWLLAGAQSVIGGLWPLADERARDFSIRLYECWTEDGTRLADAFRSAMLYVRERASGDLYGWAPFSLVGSGSTIIE